jgi:hypothetical protein
MIAKIIPRKGNGIAGASALLKYVERDGIPGGDRVAAGFDRAGNLIAYAVRERGAEIEALSRTGRCRHYLSRIRRVDLETGEVRTLEYPIETHRVLSIETAAIEFQAAANRSVRTTNPYLHVVLSWRDGEAPSNAEVFASGRRVLGALSMGEHQYVIAIHRDTGNVHAHIAANRVHPETYRAQHLSMSYLAIDRALRELELHYGWERDRGLHEIRERPARAPKISRTLRRTRSQASINPRAQSMKAWSGDRPFTEWVRDVAPALRTALNRAGSSWRDVHAIFADYNLELREKGSGFVVVDRDDPKLVAKASHIGRFASHDRLEAALGRFEPPSHERAEIGKERTTPSPDSKRTTGPSREPISYRRDPKRRADRREERAAAREKLFEEFCKKRDGRAAHADAWKRQRARERARHVAITAQKRRERGHLSFQIGQRAARTLAAAAAAVQRDEVNRAIAQERDELRASLRAEHAVSWREFVTKRALAGDEAAISALRGLRYQDGRERRSTERNGFSSPGTRTDPRLKSLEGLCYQVHRSGIVSFYRAADPMRRELFRDEGWFIAVREFGDNEMRGAMRLASEKWGPSITITGSREFKERSLKIAVELRIKVQNRELAERQRQLQRERDRHLHASRHHVFDKRERKR